MSGVAADVHLYWARIGDIGTREAEELLTDDDFVRLPELTHERRRVEYLTGRALLRLGLQRFTGRPAKSQPLRTGPTGKPECVGGPAVSVSHSGHLVACAIAPTGQIGVDIELPLHRRRTDAIARQYFSPRESDWLRGQPRDRFYMLWVLKEAYLKATGLGFAGGLDALECRVDPPNIASRAADAGAEPALALYGVEAAILGIATIGYRFSAAHAAFWNPNPVATSHETRLIATSS